MLNQSITLMAIEKRCRQSICNVVVASNPLAIQLNPCKPLLQHNYTTTLITLRHLHTLCLHTYRLHWYRLHTCALPYFTSNACTPTLLPTYTTHCTLFIICGLVISLFRCTISLILDKSYLEDVWRLIDMNEQFY